MKTKLGAGGDFAEAYVVAHEVGHHLQNVIGLAEQVMRARQRVSETEGNALTVRMELQADCFAGVWGFYADQWKQQLSPGDIDEALNAANAIGDDRLQKRSQGHVVPDSFTHGSSEQRVRWFKRGFEAGDPAQCNTFSQDLMRQPVSRL
jgi:predicted metalloprotease